MRIGLLEERSQALDHITGAFAGGGDVVENLSNLTGIGRLLLQKALCRLRVAENRGEWVADLVGDGT